MDALTALLASGMETRMQALELIANNLANASSPGYKADRERFSSYLSAAAASALQRGEGDALSQMPLIEDRYAAFQQGTLQQTASSTDLALEGEGFFAVETPRGVRYTRAGSFRLDAAGELRTKDGYRVRLNEAAPGGMAADPTQPIYVNERGELWQGGRGALASAGGGDAAQGGSVGDAASRDGVVAEGAGTAAPGQRYLGQLDVVRFARPDLLRKEEGVYFAAQPGMTPRAATASVRQGVLEASNVDAGSASMQLVSVSREFQLLNRAYNVVAAAKRGVVEQVAKW